MERKKPRDRTWIPSKGFSFELLGSGKVLSAISKSPRGNCNKSKPMSSYLPKYFSFCEKSACCAIHIMIYCVCRKT